MTGMAQTEAGKLTTLRLDTRHLRHGALVVGGGVKIHDDAHELVPDSVHEKSRRKDSSDRKDSDRNKCRDSESGRRIASDRTSDTRSDRSGSGLGTELYSTSSQPKGRSLATKAELVFGCRAPEGVYRTTDKITGLSANGEKSRPVPDTGHGSVPDTGRKDPPFAILKYKPDVRLVYATGHGSVPDTGHWAVPDTGHSTTSGTGHPKGPDSGVGPDIRYVKVVSVVKKTKRGDAASFIEPPSIPLKIHPSQSNTEQVINFLGMESVTAKGTLSYEQSCDKKRCL